MESILLSIFLNAVLPVAGSAVAGLLVWGLKQTGNFVKSKTKAMDLGIDNALVDDAVHHLTESTTTAIHDLANTVVPELKEKAADGKLSREDIIYVNDLLVSKVKTQVSSQVQDTAKKVVHSISSFILSKGEMALLDLKRHLK